MAQSFWHTLLNRNPLIRPAVLGRGMRYSARLAVLGSALFCMALAPLAGSQLQNQATVTYRNERTGLQDLQVSNIVSIRILPQEALTLTQDQSVLRAPGASVLLVHHLTNTGNTSTVYSIHYANQSGDDYDLSGLSVTQDLNSNGVADTGEPVIPVGGTVQLAFGAATDLLLSGTVPGTVTAGQRAVLTITATSQGQNRTATNTDTITVSSGVLIQLRKQATTTTPQRGEAVTFTLTAVNTGNATATGTSISVDGVATSLVVIRDVIPANTTFVRAEQSGNGRLLYHHFNTAENTYTSVPPQDSTQVDAVAIGYPSLAPGQEVFLRFTVTINTNASGDVTNIGTILYTEGTTPKTVESNAVVLTIPLVAPTIAYYLDESFTTLTSTASLGGSLFVQADAAACNQNPTAVETHPITITSTLTGDVERFTATETAANSGLFRIVPAPPTADAETHPPQSGNGQVETKRNDTLTARLEGCGAAFVEATVLIDPFGVVFDSKTNALIAGARVTLIDVTGDGNGGNAEAPASVFTFGSTQTSTQAQQSNATTQAESTNLLSAPSTVTTGSDGLFAFPLVRPSTYRLVIEAPADYTFPSVLPPALLPPDRIIEPSGSYGRPFRLGPNSSALQLDVPLDRALLGGLLVEKTPSRKIVELGDFVDYTVKITNTRAAAVEGVWLTDTLPAGFVLQRRTARLDKRRLPDPDGTPGPTLRFAIGTIPAKSTVTLVYRVRVGPGALQGDGVNRAYAESSPPLPQRSNTATAKVAVRGGVFRDEGFILGKVFLDCNRNRLQDEGEVGIPGVRLFLEDGTFVITDPEGKFSFAGITPRTHVLKLDMTTMPPGSRLLPLANRNAGDPNSRFVDMKNRDLHKADFAEGSCAPAVRDDVQERRSKSAFITEIDKGLATELRHQDDAGLVRDPRSLPASGLVYNKDTLPHFSPVVSQHPRDAATSSLPTIPVAPSASVNLAELLPTLDNSLGFIDLRDGDTLPMTQINVRVKGQAGTDFLLTANGTEVPPSRVGSKHTLPSTQTEAWEYIGVNLQPGRNTLEVSQRDGFGNVRGQQTITVIAPDKLARFNILIENPRPIADGRTPVAIRVRLEDAQGVPVTVRTAVTLEASRGRWQDNDLDPREPGHQVFITGGSATFLLLPPAEAGDVLLRVSSGRLQAETRVPFFPDLRPLIAAGVVEGIINVHKLNTKAIIPAREQDGFERQLRELAFSSDNDKVQGGGRVALFLKGKIKGDYLLTMAYDSDKDTKERLFRDIQPDEFYPVYGDSSIHGFDAQSTGRLYVRVDKNKSYLLYGDFTTETRNPASSLGDYRRSLTGGKLHYENERVSINAFASQDSTRQVVEEIPGRGISGPYTLKNTNIVENSEQIEILTRDRNQSSLVLETVPQTRFSDYAMDTLDGTILFKEPIRSVDSNLNPISIRITYEVDQGGDKSWVYGVEGQVKVTNFFQIGGSYARDDNPNDRFEIAGLNALVKLSDQTYMLAEVARTQRDSVGTGFGWRAELVHDGTRLKARVFIGRTDTDFDNPTALLGRGRFEATAKATYALTERTRLAAEIIHTEDRETQGRRDGGQVAVTHNFGNGMFAELGVRHARETARPADRPDISATPYETTSIRAKLGAQMPFLPQLILFTEYEQDIFHLDRQIVAVGGEYQFLNRGRFYAKHELISSLRGPFTLNSEQRQYNTVFGADFDYIKDGHVFSEYRLDNGISGREAQAAIGLRHRFRLTDGLTLYAGFERLHTIEGDADTSTALTGAMEYVASPRFKMTTRLEMRQSDSGNGLLNTIGAGYKISESWTLLAQHVLALTEDEAKERVRLGVAYRDTATNVWNALARYEFKYDEKDGARQAHILSATVNYQPLQPLLLSATLATKWLTDNSNGYRSRSNTYLVSTRATYDVTQYWDVGMSGSALFSDALASVQYGLGVEVGRMLTTNLWLSAGYNFFGFHDDDLVGSNYTNPGFFFRFRYKFDEELFHDAAAAVSHLVRGGKQ